MGWRKFSFLLLVTSLLVTACAPRLYVQESSSPFPEAMVSLQASIAQNGYTLSRIQRVDYGLNKRGYETDKYRVVFFGKPEEISELSRNYPELVPFLPLKITLIQKDEGVEMVAINPARLKRLYPEPELEPTFERWQRDIQKILHDASVTL
jgi:uncharacterized protein (DUF302 family)